MKGDGLAQDRPTAPTVDPIRRASMSVIDHSEVGRVKRSAFHHCASVRATFAYGREQVKTARLPVEKATRKMRSSVRCRGCGGSMQFERDHAQIGRLPVPLWREQHAVLRTWSDVTTRANKGHARYLRYRWRRRKMCQWLRV